MQDFENFEKVFYFFVRESIDPHYVNAIDANPDKDTTLTASIRDFHEMRQDLCRLILNHMGLSEPLQLFVKARGVVQYNQVPQGSHCIFGDKTLRPQDGTLIIVDGLHPFTFDKRFKTIVFYFWYIVHLPDELITNAIKWMKNQSWWHNGQVTYDFAVQKMHHHNSDIFAKQAYVKLTSVCKYIQTEMSNIRINST
jgi:hypothetical protein|tara:strand:+ start:8054 stop:8641 length:588 start_codon:yes stop_codon:yes gene_type:complete